MDTDTRINVEERSSVGTDGNESAHQAALAHHAHSQSDKKKACRINAWNTERETKHINIRLRTKFLNRK